MAIRAGFKPQFPAKDFSVRLREGVLLFYMSKSIRKVLGKEQYELIKLRDCLRILCDCAEMYGEYETPYKIKLKEVNDKIDSLKLLRTALKES